MIRTLVLNLIMTGIYVRLYISLSVSLGHFRCLCPCRSLYLLSPSFILVICSHLHILFSSPSSPSSSSSHSNFPHFPSRLLPLSLTSSISSSFYLRYSHSSSLYPSSFHPPSSSSLSYSPPPSILFYFPLILTSSSPPTPSIPPSFASFSFISLLRILHPFLHLQLLIFLLYRFLLIFLIVPAYNKRR